MDFAVFFVCSYLLSAHQSILYHESHPLLEDFNLSGELLLESRSPAVHQINALIASIAFRTYRDVIWSVFSTRRIEFFQQGNFLQLTIQYPAKMVYLGTEILITLIGASQTLSCTTCGNLSHFDSICPRLLYLLFTASRTFSSSRLCFHWAPSHGAPSGFPSTGHFIFRLHIYCQKSPACC